MVPPAVLEVLAESARSKQQASPIFEKNATPHEGAMDPASVFDAVQPQAVLLERSQAAGVGKAETTEAALCRYSELHAQTGNTFMPQWKPEYLSYVFCHEFPHVTGGPEFSEEDRLRAEDCPMVDLFEYTSGLPRRVEGQFRRHWAFTPLLWNLYFHEQVHRSRHLALRCLPKASQPLDVEEEEATTAAARCYQRLHTGTYVGAGGARKSGATLPS